MAKIDMPTSSLNQIPGQQPKKKLEKVTTGKVTVRQQTDDLSLGNSHYAQVRIMVDVNPHVSIFYYKLDSIDEVGKPEMWLKANPNLGQTVSYETYQLDVERAENSPGARNDILAKRFNLPMEGYTYFFTYEETLRHRHRDFWQLPCAMGADLSLGDDFCSFTFLFPLENGYFGVKTRDYITSYTLSQLPLAMRQKYEEFMNEGTLQVFDGTVLDMMQVYDDLDAYMAFDILKLTSLIMDAICKKARETVQSENEVSFQMESAARAATVKKTIFNMMDAARYQGNIDWDAVKASGKVDCVLLKTVSTNSKLSKRKDGLYIDPTFERNYAECKRVGLPVGVYYYTYATTKAMADAELAVLKTALAGKTFEMPVCVDVEDNKLVKLNKGSLTALVDYELRTLESWSVYALLYTGLNFSLTRLNMAKLKAYDVWVAAYRKSMKKPATSYKYGIWQYTDEARIPGVRTNADMSYAYKDYPAIIERAGLSRVKGA